MYNQIETIRQFLESRTAIQPIVGIVAGSGLQTLANSLDIAASISYASIPDFPQTTVEGHGGNLLFGMLGGKPVVLMTGRFHYYEGYSMPQVTLPVRVMKALGVQQLIVSNAAGAMHPDYAVGDIVLIRDHINLFPEHPLRGANDNRLGPRFPDMSQPYSHRLLELAKTIAGKQQLQVHSGVYAGLQGPTFETRAEYEWLRRIGADLVGMSTVPEVIVAVHGGMEVFGASIVTDIGIREEQNKITHQEVLAAAQSAAPKLAQLVAALVEAL